jgi:transcription elongation factor
LHGGTTEYVKGDKIQVNKGDLNGIKGIVVAIEEGGLITFTPTGYPELSKPLQIDIGMVAKYFEPGDLVRVTEAKYKGETGQVIDVEGPKVSMILDQSQ